ncbi:MAG: permease-like cell division protein FtsX [Patescibacteria group bacterium]
MLFFWRVLKFSLQDIIRNVWLSAVTVTILFLALLSINLLITVQLISQNAIGAVKSRMDISLYFKSEATESEIAAVKDQVASLPNVKNVLYVSRDKALEKFRAQNQDKQEVIAALRELGQNPLSPSLTITPEDVSQTEALIESLKRINSEVIESRDFSDNSLILEKINRITKRVEEVGFLLISIFFLTSLLVVYNTVRVAIYTHRQEIEIMRLVGASNYFIYLPYLASALVYTIVSLLLIIIVFYPFLSLLQPYLEAFFAGYNINILAYFLDKFFPIFGWQFLVILFINVAASLFAVRKYARI